VFPIRLKHTLAPALAALLLALSACGGNDEESSKDASSESSSESAESGSGEDQAGQPNLDDVPDVVAEVNGTEIEKAEFEDAYQQQYQQMAMQSQMSGGKVDENGLKKQVVDNLVNTELLVQEADDRGIEVSQEQADAELTKLAKQNGMKSGDEFAKALEKQGMDRETVDEQLQAQVQIQQLLAEETGDTKPSEKELRALYQTAKAQQEQAGKKGQKVPPFEQVKPQLVDQLEQQKQSEAASTLIEKLRKDAEIEVHV